MELFKYEDEILKPRRATEHSAGYDLKAKQAYVVQPGDRITVDTGVSIDRNSKDWSFLSDGHYFALHIRSSVALKGFHLINGVGVVDMDYHENIGVMLKNTTDEVLLINEHDRVAQLVLAKCLMVDLPVSSDTRKSGFGSTGE